MPIPGRGPSSPGLCHQHHPLKLSTANHQADPSVGGASPVSGVPMAPRKKKKIPSHVCIVRFDTSSFFQCNSAGPYRQTREQHEWTVERERLAEAAKQELLKNSLDWTNNCEDDVDVVWEAVFRTSVAESAKWNTFLVETPQTCSSRDRKMQDFARAEHSKCGRSVFTIRVAIKSSHKCDDLDNSCHSEGICSHCECCDPIRRGGQKHPHFLPKDDECFGGLPSSPLGSYTCRWCLYGGG
jgi:hypothetical protein